MRFDRIYRSTASTHRNGRNDKNVAIRTHTFEHEGIVIEQGTGDNYTKLNHAQVTRLHADLGQWLAAHPADETVTPLWTDR